SECAKIALSQAIFLANQYGAELHLLHVIVMHEDDPFNPAYHFPDCEEIYEQLVKIAESEMKALLTEEQGQTLRIREHQVRALAPAPAIVQYAENEDVDMIVMGGHGRRGLRRLFLGSVAEEVVRTAPCSVLTTRLSDRDPLAPVKAVVAPVDFSEESARALDLASDLAGRYGAKLHVVHAVERPVVATQYHAIYDWAGGAGFKSATEELKKALAAMVNEVDGSDVDTVLAILEGEPSKAVADHAENVDAGLIVIASHGLTGLEHFLLGSVCERLVRLAHCPVLTLRGPAVWKGTEDVGGEAATAG
ncbi:MAG: universal stress protein, partial [Holophagales bacterium]|nr:universal stress protein [Holophagales bacterium]